MLVLIIHLLCIMFIFVLRLFKSWPFFFMLLTVSLIRMSGSIRLLKDYILCCRSKVWCFSFFLVRCWLSWKRCTGKEFNSCILFELRQMPKRFNQTTFLITFKEWNCWQYKLNLMQQKNWIRMAILWDMTT